MKANIKALPVACNRVRAPGSTLRNRRPAAVQAPMLAALACDGLRRASPRQVRGSVTPRWPWYLPPRSLYEVSQTSSDSRNSTCAQPSPA